MKKLVGQDGEPLFARVVIAITAINLPDLAHQSVLTCIAHVKIVGRLGGSCKHASLIFHKELQCRVFDGIEQPRVKIGSDPPNWCLALFSALATEPVARYRGRAEGKGVLAVVDWQHNLLVLGAAAS